MTTIWSTHKRLLLSNHREWLTLNCIWGKELSHHVSGNEGTISRWLRPIQSTPRRVIKLLARELIICRRWEAMATGRIVDISVHRGKVKIISSFRSVQVETLFDWECILVCSLLPNRSTHLQVVLGNGLSAHYKTAELVQSTHFFGKRP